jgi:hypothetical protein
MKKAITLTLVLAAALSLLTACGGGSGGSGGTGGGGNDGGNAKFSGNYKYNPPADNYYVAFKSDGGSLSFEAQIGKEYCFQATEEMVEFIDYTTGKGWMRETDGTEWYPDDYDFTDEEAYGYNSPLGAMEDGFLKYFRAYGKEDSQLSEYYVGMEKVAGINCWVFDSKGLNAITDKYWIDPANGACLKYINTESGYVYGEVTEYNLNYTAWGSNMKPPAEVMNQN